MADAVSRRLVVPVLPLDLEKARDLSHQPIRSFGAFPAVP